MANQKITDLTEATTLNPTDEFVIAQAGTNKKMKVNKITTDLITEGVKKFFTSLAFTTELATKTTANLIEGINLYFTEARVRTTTLIGFSKKQGTVSNLDSVLSSIEKLTGNNEKIDQTKKIFRQDFASQEIQNGIFQDTSLYGAIFDVSPGGALSGGVFTYESDTIGGHGLISIPNTPNPNDSAYWGTYGVNSVLTTKNLVFEFEIEGSNNTDHMIVAGFMNHILGNPLTDTNLASNECFLRKKSTSTNYEFVTRRFNGIEQITQIANLTNVSQTFTITMRNGENANLYLGTEIQGVVIASHPTKPGIPMGWYLGSGITGSFSRNLKIRRVLFSTDN